MALMLLLAIYFLLPIYFLIVAATKPQGDLASTNGLAFSHFDLFEQPAHPVHPQRRHLRRGGP